MKDYAYYETHDPIPPRPVKPKLVDDTPEGARKYADALENYNSAMDTYNKGIALVRDQKARLLRELKADILVEIGMDKHPMATQFIEKIFNELGQESIPTILSEAENWAELFKPKTGASMKIIMDAKKYDEQGTIVLLDGHHRFNAAVEAGIPIIFVKK